MSSYTMTGKSMDINNIDIKKLNKIFESIDFKKDKKVDTPIDLNLCHTCGSDEIIEDFSQGILVCTQCGQVLESNIIDSNPEWKQFEDDGGISSGGRCNKISNPLLPQSSLGTAITGYGKSRLKTLHTWNAMPYRERTLNNEFKKIQQVCIKGNIPKCVEDDAKILYKLANDCKHAKKSNEDLDNKYIITRGIHRVGINAGCMYLACLKNGVTRTSKEIAILYEIKDQEMSKGLKTLTKLLKLKNVNMNMGTSKAEHFIKRYCDNLKIKNVHIGEATKIARNIEKLNVASDHTAFSVAAACILIMAENYELKTITKKKIAYVFGLSDVTITKTYKELEKCKCILLNDTAVNDVVKQMNKDVAYEEISPEILERMKKFDMLQSENNESVKKNVENEKSETIKNNKQKIEIEKSTFDFENAYNFITKLSLFNNEMKNIIDTL